MNTKMLMVIFSGMIFIVGMNAAEKCPAQKGDQIPWPSLEEMKKSARKSFAGMTSLDRWFGAFLDGLSDARTSSLAEFINFLWEQRGECARSALHDPFQMGRLFINPTDAKGCEYDKRILGWFDAQLKGIGNFYKPENCEELKKRKQELTAVVQTILKVPFQPVYFEFITVLERNLKLTIDIDMADARELLTSLKDMHSLLAHNTKINQEEVLPFNQRSAVFKFQFERMRQAIRLTCRIMREQFKKLAQECGTMLEERKALESISLKPLKLLFQTQGVDETVRRTLYADSLRQAEAYIDSGQDVFPLRRFLMDWKENGMGQHVSASLKDYFWRKVIQNEHQLHLCESLRTVRYSKMPELVALFFLHGPLDPLYSQLTDDDSARLEALMLKRAARDNEDYLPERERLCAKILGRWQLLIELSKQNRTTHFFSRLPHDLQHSFRGFALRALLAEETEKGNLTSYLGTDPLTKTDPITEIFTALSDLPVEHEALQQIAKS
jgi:hypothetical protein